MNDHNILNSKIIYIGSTRHYKYVKFIVRFWSDYNDHAVGFGSKFSEYVLPREDTGQEFQLYLVKLLILIYVMFFIRLIIPLLIG